MANTSSVCNWCCSIIFLSVAALLLAMGVFIIVVTHSTKDECIITSCEHDRPYNADYVRFSSLSHINRTGLAVFQIYQGCHSYAINSTTTCYRSLETLSLGRPDELFTGICVLLGGIGIALLPLCLFCGGGRGGRGLIEAGCTLASIL